MTTPEIESDAQIQDGAGQEEKEERKRRLLLLLLLLLLLICCCLGYFILRYLLNPQPLPEMVPVIEVNYPPTYTSMILGVDKPMGVAVSPDGQYIYVTEGSGERLIKKFNRDGGLITSFAPPGTTPSNRKPGYIAIDANGRVFVVDTYNDVIALFDADGNFLDGIIDKDMTMTEALSKELGNLPAGVVFYYNNNYDVLEYKLPDEEESKHILGPDQSDWSPLGLRFAKNGDLLVTNIVGGKHSVLIYPAFNIGASWLDFNPEIREFGVEGSEKDQLSFPNGAVTDSRGNFYISDGNNGRISTWLPNMQYRIFFGFGSDESSLNLPRGIWMDSKDRLHIADAVGQYIRVYDVSGEEPTFLFNFGEFGNAEGQFNFPTDICIDGTGRVYIADRENNRIQVWSY